MARKPKHDDDVIYVIKNNKDYLTAHNISLLTGINHQYVYKVLSRMVEQGKLVRKGKYYDTPNPKPAKDKWEVSAVATSNTSVESIQSPKSIEKSNPTIDALKDELDYIRTTVNQLVQTGEYLKVRIKELSE